MQASPAPKAHLLYNGCDALVQMPVDGSTNPTAVHDCVRYNPVEGIDSIDTGTGGGGELALVLVLLLMLLCSCCIAGM